GIKISYNIDESLPSAIDAVIFTAAVDESHPLMKAAKIRGIPTFSRAELLGHLGSEYAHSVGVAGTHGKSTTGGMISSICHNSPTCNSTYVIGAVLPFCRSAYKIGSDDKIIYEACEYKNSFLSFFPSVAVILNIELDHTDFFKNIDDMISSFRKYLSNSKSAIINADNENALKTLNGYENPYKTYSIEKNNADYYTKNLVFSHGFPSFDV
ncbi:MAG: Mur ligase family protein, partial [Clostridia bacterium]